MKFTVNSKELAEAVNDVAAVIPQRTPITFYYNISCWLTKNELELRATDGDIVLKKRLKVKSNETGIFRLKGGVFRRLCAKLPDKDVTVVQEKNNITFQGPGFKYDLKDENMEGNDTNWCAWEDEDVTARFMFASETLKEIIHLTRYAISFDELRPCLTGMHMSVEKGKLRVATTDGHRLVRLYHPSVIYPDDFEAIIPLGALNLIEKQLQGKILAEKCKGRIKFYVPEQMFEVNCKLIEGKFPNVDFVIPKKQPFKLVVDRGEMLSALKRLLVVASPINRRIIFTLYEGNDLVINTENPDTGNHGQETIQSVYKGDPLEIGFGANYLYECLDNMRTEDVWFHFEDTTSACIIKPVEKDSDFDTLTLIMPIRLQ